MIDLVVLQVYAVFVGVGVIWDLIASFSFLVTVAVAVAVAVWAETPVTVAVARLVKGEGHAEERRNNFQSVELITSDNITTQTSSRVHETGFGVALLPVLALIKSWIFKRRTASW